MKTANGVEVNIAEATNYLESSTNAALSHYAESTERNIIEGEKTLEALRRAATEVIKSLDDEIKRNKKQLDDNKAFAYRIHVEQESR